MDEKSLKVSRQQTNSSPKNVQGSKFKKFEYKDDLTNLVYPVSQKVIPKGAVKKTPLSWNKSDKSSNKNLSPQRSKSQLTNS